VNVAGALPYFKYANHLAISGQFIPLHGKNSSGETCAPSLGGISRRREEILAMKECLIVVGMFFSGVAAIVSIDFVATSGYYPNHTLEDVGRVVAMGYP